MQGRVKKEKEFMETGKIFVGSNTSRERLNAAEHPAGLGEWTRNYTEEQVRGQ